jgi:hypothetical protein
VLNIGTSLFPCICITIYNRKIDSKNYCLIKIAKKYGPFNWLNLLICKKATTKRVAGIGGVFFKAQNTDKMKGLYGKHLGFNCDQYGTSFSWRKKEKS